MQSMIIKRNAEIVSISKTLYRNMFEGCASARFIHEIFDFKDGDISEMLACENSAMFTFVVTVKHSGKKVCLTIHKCDGDFIHLIISYLKAASLEKSLSLGRDFNESYFFDALSISGIATWYISDGIDSVKFSEEIETILQLENSIPLNWSTFKKAILTEDRIILREVLLANLELYCKSSCIVRVANAPEERWIEITGIKKTINGSNAYFGTIRDCSLEQISVSALNDANEYKRLALETGNIGAWRVIKSQNKYTFEWDDRANNLIGLSTDDFGKVDVLFKYLERKDSLRFIRALKTSFTTGNEFNELFTINSPLKNVIHVLVKGVINNNNETSRLDGVVIDQTQSYLYQKQLQQLVKKRTEELNDALKHSQKVSAAKSDFLSMMSHELRTPMNAIVGSLELMEQSKNCSFEEQELIGTASSAAKNLIQILNDILDLNKVESGKLELEYSAFDISSMLQGIITVFSDSAWQQNVVIEVNESANLPQEVHCDEARLKQIIFNLVSNAIKFSKNSEKHGTVKLSVNFKACQHPPHELIVDVVDNGIGISKETQKKLFTPFVQAERSTTRKYGGTGLGLAISGRLLDLMGGSFHLDSQVGKGSKFSISIPIWEFRRYLQDCNFTACLINFDEKSKIKMMKMLHFLGCKITSEHLAEIILLGINKIEDLHAIKLNKNSVLCFNDKSTSKAFRDYKNVPFLILSECTYSRLSRVINIAANSSALPLSSEQSSSKEVTNQVLFKHPHPELLLIEDNPINQELIVKQLRNIGYECDVADNGYQGFELYKKGEYSLILTDCHMPEIDGYELTRIIRKYEVESGKVRTPIVAVTGAAMKGDKDLCVKSGMDDFLSKPISLQKLKATVERWCNGSESTFK